MSARPSIAGLGATVAVALLLVSVASASAPHPAERSPVIVGGTKAQRQLARMTALRVGAVSISRVIFRAPSRVLRHEHVRGSEMVVLSRGKQTIRSDWEQELYIGAYLGFTTRWPKARIAAASGFLTEGPTARLPAYDVFGSNPKTAVVATLRRRLSDDAIRAGGKIVEERTSALPARVIAMTLRVDDPASFLEHHTKPLLHILGAPGAPLLGYYLGVEDARGALVFATSRLPNTGGVFVIPQLDGCSPVAHSEPGGIQPPPPCPAS